MAIQHMPGAATRVWSESHGVPVRPLSMHCQPKLHRLLSSPLSQTPHSAFLPRNLRAYPRLFASASSSPPFFAQRDNENSIGPRMPAEPEPRPKPTTAVEVVEAYIDNLWRDFFTCPYRWMDNRLRKRAPKYADFKNKITKEGLWITTKYNPPWVRAELALMTNFRPVPYNDPMWVEEKENADIDGKASTRLGQSSSGATSVTSRESQSQHDVPSRPSFAGSRNIRVDVWRRSDSESGSSVRQQ